MGLFKNIVEKLNKGFVYVVDKETLLNYMDIEEKFAVENNLEMAYDFYIYINSEKHHLNMWNYQASSDESERSKGIKHYFDDIEYDTIDELVNTHLTSLPQYFKIELIYSDHVYLNEYRDKHPELQEQ